jgi:hypothetical protein
MKSVQKMKRMEQIKTQIPRIRENNSKNALEGNPVYLIPTVKRMRRDTTMKRTPSDGVQGWTREFIKITHK